MAAKPLPEIVRWSQELLSPLGPLRTKAMFGGWGFYCDELFFALIADDVLYLKADEAEAQEEFRRAGSAPFRYTYPDGRTITMGYWSAPEEAMDSPVAMQPWARLAMASALRAAARKNSKPVKAKKTTR